MTDRNFGGIEVVGEYSEGSRELPEQRPLEELVYLLKQVLANPVVEAVKWRQYTPYFNDGEPCVFGVHEPYVKLVGADPEAGDYEDGFIDSYDDRLSNRRYDHETRKFVPKTCELPELAELFRVFSGALVDGTHYIELKKVFGDHCEVTATPEKIEVEYYEHD